MAALPALIAGCTVNVARPTPPAESLPKLSIRDLCAAYAPSRDPVIRSEISKRGEFSEAEWKRIDRGQRKPDGMRESVLWCAWGLPGDFGDITTTTTGATRYRYTQEFAGGYDIVVTNGVVTDWTAF